MKEIIEQNSEQSTTTVLRGSEAPAEVKENPFYNPYMWGRAEWEDDRLYLPDSEQGISWAVAAHELGHLVDAGRIQPSIENFQAAYAEEERAWEEGWPYLKKYILEYYENVESLMPAMEWLVEKAKKEMMEQTKLSEDFYGEEPDDLNEKRREFLVTDKGQEIKKRLDNWQNFMHQAADELHQPRFKEKIDWERFVEVIKKTLIDIEADNKND